LRVPFSVDFDDPGELTDANYPTARDVRYPGPTDDRREVMIAVALEADAAEHNYFVIALEDLEGLLQNQRRILAVPGEILLKGSSRNISECVSPAAAPALNQWFA
jgi:hypothetical protein